MGFLRRIFGGGTAAPAASRPVVLIEGYDDLAVVGESNYQDALSALVGGGRERVRLPIQAALLAETDNKYDRNAISVWIGGRLVGYVAREDAAALRPGLLELERRHGAAIALPGVIVGGGSSTPSYGVFLNLDSTAFGLASSGRGPNRRQDSQMRTGLSNAVANDAANDDYDLAWQYGMPDDTLKSIAYLRAQLAAETAPVSRHFMFMSLADRLYGARDEFASALDEFDEVCRSHDAEMETIRAALIKSFGGLPLLEVYKQAAIRHQKAHDWQTALWWAQRGLEVYGTEAINAEVVEDLRGRIEKYTAKLSPPVPRQPRPPRAVVEVIVVETLVCRTCGQSFDRERTRGRKPVECPSCRGQA